MSQLTKGPYRPLFSNDSFDGQQRRGYIRNLGCLENKAVYLWCRKNYAPLYLVQGDTHGMSKHVKKPSYIDCG